MRGCFREYNKQRVRRESPSPAALRRARALPSASTSPRTQGEARTSAETGMPMQYDPSDLKPRERYKVLTSFVLPRPIAWVTSMGPAGVVNAAPFSFFNVFCEDPPLCMFAANLRPDGRVKDTVINIRATNEFVVNMTDEALAHAMHESSGDFPPEIGEPDYLNLNLAPSTKIAVPRLADAPFAMECRTWKEIDVNGDRLLVMGEGIHFHIRDELWDHAAMRVHMERYHPIGRMFADRYCRTDDRVVFPPAEGAKTSA
ncbi:flavin reductase (DIM6/NTAB) family NADH-FMN oxidoreductase RutF [Bradyrhizobium algeriense]|uniref:Flavin reductase (DIM6/NTAB) family NADH-FMN oxidoreductase RutF n=2 Tax=Bradyrhizobium algeriense TaxID=634784 RepID=A0ABU8BEA9_9BRAD